MRTPPTYRARLRIEGTVLAAVGLVGAVVLAALERRATDYPESTVVQLAVVAAGLAWLGPRIVRRALEHAQPIAGTAESLGSGEPTPLWHLPLVVAALTAPFALAGSPDAVLRVLGGCALVGLAQALLLAGIVARAERAGGREFVRLPGSRILRGTRLGWLPAAAQTEGALP